MLRPPSIPVSGLEAGGQVGRPAALPVQLPLTGSDQPDAPPGPAAAGPRLPPAHTTTTTTTTTSHRL